jgi:hypothetical protein
MLGEEVRQRPKGHVTSDEVHLGGPGGVEGRSSSLSHHIMLKMALVDASWWLSSLGDGDWVSNRSRRLLNEAIIIFSKFSAFLTPTRLRVLLLLL